MPVLVFCIIVSFMLSPLLQNKILSYKPPNGERLALRKIRNGTRFIRFIFRDKPILLELSTARIIVGVLFVLFGSASVFNGFRQYKHFLPLAVKEAEVYEAT
ncbi:YtpI family protein [Bacillus cereus]